MSVGLPENDKDKIFLPFLRKEGDGKYVISILGRSGEPNTSGKSWEVRLAHRDFDKMLKYKIISDASGNIHLGSLDGISTVQVEGKSWNISNESCHSLWLSRGKINYANQRTPHRPNYNNLEFYYICCLRNQEIELPLPVHVSNESIVSEMFELVRESAFGDIELRDYTSDIKFDLVKQVLLLFLQMQEYLI